jgi:hypothetical protein
MSASKELESGARAMLLLAEGLFRLDVVIAGDTLRMVVRNLTSGELEIESGDDYRTGANIVCGDAAAYQPARARVRFTLRDDDGSVDTDAVIGTLRFADRGTIRVSAQAVVRRSPAP